MANTPSTGSDTVARYAFSYADDTVYERVVTLAAQHFAPAGIVIDVGCGHGAVAEALTERGFRYLGIDVDETGLKDLSGRGFETSVCDLTVAGALEQAVTSLIGTAPLSGILFIDCLEHVVDGVSALRQLRHIAEARGGAALVVSVPNVTHVDLGIKLLMGRWDYTETGLLDDTHVAFFDERRLEQVTRQAGWLGVGNLDFSLHKSDQHFPADAVPLAPDAMISGLLRHLRDRAAYGSEVNQWVRAYRPTRARSAALTPEVRRPFLSVLTRTQGVRLETLQETLLCLSAQSESDFEVMLLAHSVTPERQGDLRYLVNSLPEDFASRVRIIPVAGGGRCRPLNVGVAAAWGRYVAVLDDDDVVLGHWVESFRKLADRWPGRVLRGRVASQDIEDAILLNRPSFTPVSRTTTPYPAEFDLFDHIVENRTPPCGLAFPVSAFRDLGIRFDESLPVLEDWDVLLQTAPWCGVAETADVIAIYRRWRTGESSSTLHKPTEWSAAHDAIIARLDNHVQVMPRGTLARIREGYRQRQQAELTVAEEIKTTLAVARHRDDQLATIERIREDNQALRVHIAHLETVITKERNQTAADLARSRAEAALSARDQARQEIWESTSWRITKPMRLLSRLLNKRRSR